MTVYLDYSATTPVLPEVADIVYKTMVSDYGNAGSRTHEYGLDAKRIVEHARKQVAATANVDKTEVIFTSGATESNNIVILGLQEYAERINKKHIITTKIEHKAVLEPVAHLEKLGFEVTYIDVTSDGKIDVSHFKSSLRDDTVLVSIMHINNETGVIQPLDEIGQILSEHNAYFHVDAAQSFGKFPFGLEMERIDFISISGHKLYAPKGIGALIMRRRGFIAPPLEPISYGGGQEKGLRPGTLSTPLIAGLGLACEIASKSALEWVEKVSTIKNEFKEMLSELGAVINGNDTSPYILNFSIPGINSEAAMVQLKGIIAVSNGSACTSKNYTPSHVLTAMNLGAERIDGAIRVSFGVNCPDIPYLEIIDRLKKLK